MTQLVIHLHINCHLIHEKISLMKELRRKRVTLQDRASHELITNKNISMHTFVNVMFLLL